MGRNARAGSSPSSVQIAKTELWFGFFETNPESLLSGIAGKQKNTCAGAGRFYFQPVEKGLADCTGGNSCPNPESLLSGIAENKEHLRRQAVLFSACGKGTADCTGGNFRPNPESLLSGIAENKRTPARRQGRFYFQPVEKDSPTGRFQSMERGANFTEGNGWFYNLGNGTLKNNFAGANIKFINRHSVFFWSPGLPLF